jgi:hypothetical protein
MLSNLRRKNWRIPSVFVCQVLLLQFVLVQPSGAQGNGLRIDVLEGSDAKNVVQQIAPKAIIVRVQDSNNRPVSGATVEFSAPQVGPSGDFENDSRTIRILTAPDGRAGAGPYHPNSITGNYQIRVTADFQGQTGAIAVPQTNIGEKKSHGKLLATIAIGAAVAGAAFAFKGKDNGSSSTPSGPTITFGGSAVGAPKQ